MTLEEWLRDSGESMTALAQRCGVHPATVLRWKNGERRPRPRQMAALTRATQGQVRAQDFQIDAHAGTPYWINPLADAGPSVASGLAETRGPFAAEAEALGLDAAAIAAQAVREAIRAEKARRWLAENSEAIEAWNRWTESNGLPLAEYGMF